MRYQAYTKCTYEASRLQQMYIWGFLPTPSVQCTYEVSGLHQVYIWGLRPTPIVHIHKVLGLHQVFIWGLRSTPFINMRLQAYNKCTMYIWGLRPTPSVHMRHQAYIKCTYEASGLHKGLSLFTKLASALGYSWNLHTRRNILQLIFLHSIYIIHMHCAAHT